VTTVCGTLFIVGWFANYAQHKLSLWHLKLKG
jgi:hypothetical protein